MFLICGLGNPGIKYSKNRHNVGFKLVDKIIKRFLLTKVKDDKIKQLFNGKINGHKVFVLKPLTFMNLSGKVISEILNFYKIGINNTFVVHDDLDLKLAKIKLKKGGGSGGHNGLESIDEFIGNKYYRIRIGIDHPGNKDLVPNYVLNNFTAQEESLIDTKLELINDNISLIFSDIPLFLTRISENK